MALDFGHGIGAFLGSITLLLNPWSFYDISRGPYIQQATPTSVVVRYRTNKPIPSVVKYGNVRFNLDKQVSDSVLSDRHELVLGDLKPNTKYYYEVYAIDDKSQEFVIAGDDKDQYFISPPLKGSEDPTRIWVLGDPGVISMKDLPKYQARMQYQVRDSYYKYDDKYTDMILLLGDNAYHKGTDEEYQVSLFDFYKEKFKQSVVWPTFGNHDYGFDYDTLESSAMTFPKEQGVYYDVFTMPKKAESGGVPSGAEAFYSYNFANIHFVSLDTTDSIWEDPEENDTREDRRLWAKESKKSNKMIEWLKKDLEANKQDWIIAFFHHPPYSNKPNHSDDSESGTWVRENVLPLLESAGTDLVLSGHNHRYQRTPLLNGYYGKSDTLDKKSMILDPGDGSVKGSGFYKKATYHKTVNNKGANEGTIYAVPGGSGRVSKTKNHPDHPVMIETQKDIGSMVIDVNGNRLDAKYLNGQGQVTDEFTIIKGPVDKWPTNCC